MFWVIFDTSTKRDYYRDVHNLLAMSPGDTIRYDYNEKHLSPTASEKAGKGLNYADKVLLAYVQTRSFSKGDSDPVGPIPYEKGLWVGTRIALLRHLRLSVNRYYFYLEVLGYPDVNNAVFGEIMHGLAAAGDAPFSKWVATSELDAQFDALTQGAASDTWAAVINQIGVFPSQFAGDSFWRISKIVKGPQKSGVQPLLRERYEVVSGTKSISAIEAVFPILELDNVALEIESRLPETGEEPRSKEPEVAREITFEAASDGPLKEFNSRTLTLRRYGRDSIEAEIDGTDRVSAKRYELRMKTGPATGSYPIGPEFPLRFEVAKSPIRAYLGLLFALVGVVSGVVGVAVLKDHIGWGVVLVAAGVLVGLVAYFLWSGKVKLPAPK